MNYKGGKQLKELVGRCLTGDTKAWDQLIEAVTPVVFAICRSMRLSRDESIEVFGQVCYLLVKNLSNLKLPEKILSWVATTARREALAIIRKSRLFEDIYHDELVQPISDIENNPEEALDSSQKSEILLKAILRLPEKESRLMLSLFLDRQEPTYEEISERLDMPVSSIGPTRARCLVKLRRILKKMGYQFLVFLG